MPATAVSETATKRVILAAEMTDHICVITGATSGLGRAAALALGDLGCSLILLGRNERAGRAVAARVGQGGSARRAEFLRADLSSVADVRRAAAEIRTRTATLDVLINNAGARFDDYQASADGTERTFATNHLGHFLLTALLLDPLLAARSGRVITVASEAHAAASIGDGWVDSRASYDRKAAYARSKLANVVFAFELARRLEETAVTSNAVDPGGVATNLGRNNGLYAWMRHLAYYALKRELQSPGRAARTIVNLASGTLGGGRSGAYFRDLREHPSSPLSGDPGAASQLWDLSVRLTGLDASLGGAWKYVKP